MTGRTAALIGTAALVASLSACSSSGKGAADTTTAAVPLSTPAVSPPPTTSPAPTLTTPVSSPPSSTTAASTPTKSTAPRSTCTNVTVRVIRGSASLGQEIAALQFTNEGTSTCLLVGFPTVTLLRKGQQLGNPSQPSSPGGVSSRTLGAGEVAESVLHDYTACNAKLSDSLRVQIPGTSTTVIRPGELRGCILRIDKLGPPQ